MCITLVKKHFDFLIDDYGFSELEENIGYKFGALEIEFYTGKGETDILFFVRRDDDIFRPYISRSFEFLKVAEIINGSKLAYPESLTGYKVTDDDNDQYLAFCANLMTTFCKDILKGDLSILEKIHLERRKLAGS